MTLCIDEYLEISSDFFGCIGALLVIVPVFHITRAQASLFKDLKVIEEAPDHDPHAPSPAAVTLRATIARIAEFRAADWQFMKFGSISLGLALLLRVAYQFHSKFMS